MTTWANPFQVNIHARCIVCFLTKAQWIPRTLGKDSVYIKKIGLYASQNQKQTNRAKVVYWQRKTCFSSIGKQTNKNKQKSCPFREGAPGRQALRVKDGWGPEKQGPQSYMAGVLSGDPQPSMVPTLHWGPTASHGSNISLRTHSLTEEFWK